MGEFHGHGNNPIFNGMSHFGLDSSVLLCERAKDNIVLLVSHTKKWSD